MKHPNIRIARLQEMIALEEKRASLQNNIDVVNARLVAIQKELYGGGVPQAVTIRDLQAPAKKMQTKAKGKRKGRGELKGQILEMLHAAGNVGASVRELADRIGVKAANVHSFFSANIKKIAGLKKVGAARYAVSGGAAAAKPEKKGKGAKAKKGKEAKASKVKAPKAKKGKAGKAKSGRGQLKQQILGALKAAGPEGITVKELAEKLNANYKNVYIWFVTTGKKIAGIKKVGPAQYKLEA